MSGHIGEILILVFILCIISPDFLNQVLDWFISAIFVVIEFLLCLCIPFVFFKGLFKKKEKQE